MNFTMFVQLQFLFFSSAVMCFNNDKYYSNDSQHEPGLSAPKEISRRFKRSELIDALGKPEATYENPEDNINSKRAPGWGKRSAPSQGGTINLKSIDPVRMKRAAEFKKRVPNSGKLITEDSEEIQNIPENYSKQAPGWGKRAPGWGKRAPGWGKRAPGWGKRAPGWGKRAPGWGKRSTYKNDQLCRELQNGLNFLALRFIQVKVVCKIFVSVFL